MKLGEGNLSHRSENLRKSKCHEIFLLVEMKDCPVSIELEITSERQSPRFGGRCL